MTRGRGVAALLFFSVIGAAVDLAAKAWVFQRLGGPGPTLLLKVKHSEILEVVPGLLDLRLALNEGAAFSLFRGQLNFFYVVSALAFTVLCYFAWSAPRGTSWRFSLTLGLLGAGMLGNLYDRLAFGYVRDFLDTYASYPPVADRLVGWFGPGGNHWPIFNVADALICVGALLLVLRFSREARQPEQAGAVPEKA